MSAPLRLISHKLCPYVQRAVIALTEKGVAFERIDIGNLDLTAVDFKADALFDRAVLKLGEDAHGTRETAFGATALVDREIEVSHDRRRLVSRSCP